MVTNTTTITHDASTPTIQRRVFPLGHLRPHKTYVRRDVRMVLIFNPKVGTTTLRTALIDGLDASC